MEYRVKDYNYFEKQGNKWLFADILEKPTEIVKYRKKTEGGLGLHHIRSKSMAILIKTFIVHGDYMSKTIPPLPVPSSSLIVACV